ncbi:MAG TPA: carboxypeptidase-like regulatory domain-containing protein [Gemmatimonadaceae bacterium]
MRRISFFIAALSLAVASSSSAQRVNTIKPVAPSVTADLTLDGIVRDNNGRPLAAAEVVVDAEHRAITNTRGEFSIPGLAPGVIEFMARRIGYTPINTAVQVEPGLRAVHVAVKLMPLAIELGTIVVDGKRMDKTLWQTGFYRRAEIGNGTYFDDAYMRNFKAGMASLMSTVTSVYVDRASNGTAVALGRLPNGASCPLSVYVDGNFVSWARETGLDGVVSPEDVLGVEVYPRASEMPARISGLGGGRGVGAIGTIDIRGGKIQGGNVFGECGAILIWTKPFEKRR